MQYSIEDIKEINKELDLIEGIIKEDGTMIQLVEKSLLEAKEKHDYDSQECCESEIEEYTYVKNLLCEKHEDLINSLRSIR